MSTPGDRPTDPRLSTGLGGALVVVLALALRLGSVGYGLDFEDPTRAVLNAQVDETAMVDQELELMRGDWQPGTFLLRGTGPFYVAGAVDAAVLGLLAALRGETWDATVARYEDNPSLIFLVHRLLAACTGAATVLVVMRICRRELDARHAIVAGSLLACAHMHVHLSTLGLVDVPWVLFAMLALERALRIARAPRRSIARAPRKSDYLLAGLWVGLAGATKYPGALVCLAVPAAHLVARWRSRRAGEPRPGHGLVAAAGATSIAVFLALSPRLLLAPEEYVEAFRTQVEILDIDAGGASYPIVLAGHLRNLTYGLGEPVLALAGVGLLLALWRGGQRRRLALLLLLVLPTTLVAKLPAPRFATGFLVATVPLAAIGLVGLVGLVERTGRARAFLAGAVLLAVAPSLTRALTLGVVLSRPDTRPETLAELRARGIDREDVYGVGHRGLPMLMGRPEPYVVLSREVHRKGAMTLRDVLRAPPPYLLRDLSGESGRERATWKPIEELIDREYEEVFRADGWPDRVGLPPLRIYLTLRTFVPFASPWEVSRPGPILVLYRHREHGAG